MRLMCSVLLCACTAAPAQTHAPDAQFVADAGQVVAPSAPTMNTPSAPAAQTVTSAVSSAPVSKPVTIANGTASVGSPSRSSSGEDDRPIDFEVAGDLSSAQKSVLTIVGRCFVNALDRGEESKGALWVEVTIDDGGKATGVKLADGFSPNMKECIPPRVSHVTFPAAPNDGSIHNASRVLRFPINEMSAETSED